jgi:hypothetical protein
MFFLREKMYRDKSNVPHSRGCSKPSVFGTASLDLLEKPGFWPVFRRACSKTNRVLEQAQLIFYGILRPPSFQGKVEFCQGNSIYFFNPISFAKRHKVEEN